jgi:GAF domain-containing protein
LFKRTQDALAQTETLYDINRDLSAARDEDGLLQVVARPAVEFGAIEASLQYIDLNLAGDPEWIEFAAVWSSGQSQLSAPEGGRQPSASVGSRVHVSESPLSRLWMSDPGNPLFITNVATDERIAERSWHGDENLKRMMAQAGNHAVALIPLAQAGRWVGLLTFTWGEPHAFSEQEAEIYRALSGLAAPVVESRRLLSRAQALAQREQQLREIAERLRTPPDVDGVLRALARELGQALGRRIFVRLAKEQQQIPAGER